MCVYTCVFEVRFRRKTCNVRHANWIKREECVTCGEAMVDVFWAFLTCPFFTIIANTLDGDVCLVPCFFFFVTKKRFNLCKHSFYQSPFLLLTVPTLFSHADSDRRLHSAWSEFWLIVPLHRFKSFFNAVDRPVNCSLFKLCLLRSWSTPKVPTDRRCSTRRWRWASPGAHCSETCCSAPTSSTSTRWPTDRWVWGEFADQSAKLELFYPLRTLLLDQDKVPFITHITHCVSITPRI